MKTIIEIRDAIAGGETKAEEIVKTCLDKIQAEDEQIGAFLETFDEEAIKTAKKIDLMRKAGEDLPRLAGVPIAIKDNMLYTGHTASAGSKMLERHVAAYDATVVMRLKEAGAIIIGRTNMDEFAMGSSTETSFWKKTRNPVDTTKVPGGSSGGSAAAVAAGFVPAALGSDTGGSIRQPAALCGVVGLKPTYGRVSRYGLIALGSSLDQIGPITNTAQDAALILEIIEGGDPKDATSLDLEEKTLAELINPSVEGMKIGVPKEFFVDEMDSEVRKRVEEAIDLLKEHGAEIIDVSLPLTEYALPAYYIIQPAEASSNLARFDGMRYGTRAQTDDLIESYTKARGDGFGIETKRRIMLGTYILSAGYYEAYYKKAQAVRTAIFDELQDVLKKVDVIVTPTSPSVAWDMDEKFGDPITMYLSDIFTTTANIAGIPAISVPCGTAHDLPVGLQFMAGIEEDGKVLQAAAAYEVLT
ncbi:Asp-tRNA(Asn)/Glu-tRNA(Gln) amidotransferase subunit GatA [Patescibacteria group bacterium]|nr:Asp-tRNA(Asn)/Glu-tRNA(Gln) amidotransferase subunit GatA [Patescibacteria group bacterium]